MAAPKFRLKLAGLRKGVRYQALDFSAYTEDGDALSDPIITSVCGKEMDYGKLFAYCFRRFGYPNWGWDNYKELACYLLTTPRPDMLLRIIPYVGDTSSIAIRFLIPGEAVIAVGAYARRFRDDWTARAFAWREQQGLPDWMPEWVAYYNNEFRAMHGNSFPERTDWRQCVNFYFSFGSPGTRVYELTAKVVEFRKNLDEDYKKIEAFPAYYHRPLDWKTWGDEDPLKPYAEAAIVALQDLYRPVGVRDQAINAFGTTEFSRSCAPAAAAAGYPSGDLANTAPAEFAELHGLILKLGNGNAKRGIAKAKRLLSQES